MGAAARRFVEQNRLSDPFSAILDSEAYRARIKQRKRAAANVADDDVVAPPDTVDNYLLDHRVHRTVEASA
jgi:hypothetical protein